MRASEASEIPLGCIKLKFKFIMYYVKNKRMYSECRCDQNTQENQSLKRKQSHGLNFKGKCREEMRMRSCWLDTMVNRTIVQLTTDMVW